MSTSVLEVARSYVRAGLSVIPVGLDGAKQPAFDVLPRVPDPKKPDRFKPTWKPFEERFATDDELQRWHGGERPYAIAVACGRRSNGAELIDLDDKDTAREFCRIVQTEEPALYNLLSLESTPNGAHVWYLTDAGEGNRVLAGRPDGFDASGRPKVKKTIETRGQGGYAVVAGSPLEVHEKKIPYQHVGGPPLTALARITAEDRDYLFRLAMSFDRQDRRTQATGARPDREADELSPGDDYDLRGEPFSELLPAAEFSAPGADEGNVRRPGKERGNSATVGHCRGSRGEPLLHVFTSNWHPFEANKCYGRFQVLRLTKFGGDGAATTRHLRGQGYGSAPAGTDKVSGKTQSNSPASDAHWTIEEPETARTSTGPGAAVTGSRSSAEKPPLPREKFCDMEPVLDVSDFVEDLLTEQSLSVVYGDSNTGKSFFVIDLALSVASGMPWRGREVETGGVLYLALEGSHGIRNRIAAYKLERRCRDADLPFQIVPVSVDLCDPEADTLRVIEAVRDASAEMGVPVKLSVVDTLSRAMGGGNENSPDDMGALVRNVDLIRQATKSHVCLIHHSGKDAAKGARGHSCLKAAADTEIEVTHDAGTKTSTATVSKQRDMDKGDVFGFQLKRVELGVNRRGKMVTSCVVTEAEAVSRDPSLPTSQQTALAILDAVIADQGREGFPGVPTGIRSVPEAWWRERLYRLGKPGEKQEAKQKSYKRAFDGLVKAGRVGVHGERVWIS